MSIVHASKNTWRSGRSKAMKEPKKRENGSAAGTRTSRSRLIWPGPRCLDRARKRQALCRRVHQPFYARLLVLLRTHSASRLDALPTGILLGRNPLGQMPKRPSRSLASRFFVRSVTVNGKAGALHAAPRLRTGSRRSTGLRKTANISFRQASMERCRWKATRRLHVQPRAIGSGDVKPIPPAERSATQALHRLLSGSVPEQDLDRIAVTPRVPSLFRK